MTKNKAEAYGQKIDHALRRHGWELSEIKNEAEWYAVEHWFFKSIQQAYGETIIVSSMIDPQCDNSSTILYIRAGNNIPTYWSYAEGQIAEFYMGGRGDFKQKLSAFVEEINDYRNMLHASSEK